MFRKRITRPMPSGAKLSRDGKKAKVTVKGELRTYEVSSTGKLVDYSPRWYCQIGSKMIPLSEDRTEAGLMEAELLLDHKRGGSVKAKKPAVPKSRRELAALMDDWISTQFGTGFHKKHIAASSMRVRILLDAGITTAAHLEDAGAGRKIQQALDRLAESDTPLELPDGEWFTPQSLYLSTKVSRGTLLDMAKTLGISGTGLKKSRRYSRGEAEQILSHMAKGAAPATVQGYRVAITSFCRWLVSTGIIHRIPALQRTRGIPQTLRPRRAITVECLYDLVKSVEAKGVTLAHTSAHARALLYRTAFFTALRLRALREARVSDLLLDQSGEWSLAVRAETDKTGLARRIPIVERGLGGDLAALVKGRPGSAIIWPKLPASMVRALQSDLRDAGIPFATPEGKLDFHSFRHSAATHYLTRGVSPLVVAQIGGWASLSMIQKRYGHLDASNLGDLLKGGR